MALFECDDVWMKNEISTQLRSTQSILKTNKMDGYRNARTHHSKPMKVLRMKEKQQNNKISELWMCINLTHFSRSYYTQVYYEREQEQHASNHNRRIHNQFLFPQKTAIFSRFFSTANIFVSWNVIVKQISMRISSCLSLNFFSFASFQVHIKPGSEFEHSHKHRQKWLFLFTSEFKIDQIFFHLYRKRMRIEYYNRGNQSHNFEARAHFIELFILSFFSFCFDFISCVICFDSFSAVNYLFLHKRDFRIKKWKYHR